MQGGGGHGRTQPRTHLKSDCFCTCSLQDWPGKLRTSPSQSLTCSQKKCKHDPLLVAWERTQVAIKVMKLKGEMRSRTEKRLDADEQADP